MLVIVISVSVQIFNKSYLKDHVASLQQPANGFKSIIDLKTLIGSGVIILCLMFGILGIQASTSKEVEFPFGPFIADLVLLIIVCYFSMKNYVIEYTTLQIRKHLESGRLVVEQYKRSGKNSVEPLGAILSFKIIPRPCQFIH